MRTTWTYLATPHGHPTRLMRRWRSEAAKILQAHLMDMGIAVYCPIAASHDVGELMKRPFTHEEWLNFDKPFLYHANQLCVGKLPGWEDSKGIAWEVAEFEALKKPIWYLEPNACWAVLGDELWEKLNRTFKEGTP